MEIHVTLYDPEGSPGPALLPDNVPMHRLIPALVDKLNLPEIDPADDSLLVYSLYQLPSGELIPQEMTLTQANIKDGGKLSLERFDTDREAFAEVSTGEMLVYDQLSRIQIWLAEARPVWQSRSSRLRQRFAFYWHETKYLVFAFVGGLFVLAVLIVLLETFYGR